MCNSVPSDAACFDRYMAVTNRHLCTGDYLEQIRKIAGLHPGGLILREKDLSEKEYEALARRVLAICQKEEVPCFLHGHIGLARKLGCRRIHLPLAALTEASAGASGAAPGPAFADPFGPGPAAPLSSFTHISVSCHSADHVRTAAAHGATQIVLGNIFETDCKKGLPGKGLDFLREICAWSPVPIYAIGGITPENFPEIRAAGAAGGCMMSGFMRI